MEMKTPYYIMKIYDKNNCVVETEEDDDYDYICETFAWRFMNELDRKEGKTGKIFKVTKGKKGRIYRKWIESFEIWNTERKRRHHITCYASRIWVDTKPSGKRKLFPLFATN